MQGLGSRVEPAVDLERRESRVGASVSETVAGKGFEQAPLLEDLDDIGTAVSS